MSSSGFDSLNLTAPAASGTAGEILRDQFMGPLNLSAGVLARELEVTTELIIEVLNGACGVTEDLAIRLGHRFNNSARFWLNLPTADEIASASDDFPPVTNTSVVESRIGAESGVPHANLA
jgi:addiction module HigA family antidote